MFHDAPLNVAAANSLVKPDGHRAVAAAPERPARETTAEREPAVVNSIGMRLARIPAGEFLMGNLESSEELAHAFPAYEPERLLDLSDEQPAHSVRITRPFYLGMHQVTIGQFVQFVVDAGYSVESERDGTGGWGYVPGVADFVGRSPEFSWQNPGFRQGKDHPVVNVTWDDCQAFCDWLSDREGRTYRLPTEAEWEYACRAGTTTRFHQGDDPETLAQVANLYDATTRPLFPQWEKYAIRAADGYEFTAPVGSFRPNNFGLHDMHGNVWEWCSDWYGEDYYAQSPVNDPPGPESGDRRVRRGGSWHSWPLYMRASFRNWNTPDTRYLLVGFRVALEIE